MKGSWALGNYYSHFSLFLHILQAGWIIEKIIASITNNEILVSWSPNRDTLKL